VSTADKSVEKCADITIFKLPRICSNLPQINEVLLVSAVMVHAFDEILRIKEVPLVSATSPCV
jgi:hypothetical protein